MLRNMIRRSGMLALVLALALAGTAPATALDFGGRSLDGWHTIWSWLADAFGWDGEAAGSSGGLKAVYEGDGSGLEPNGSPVPAGTSMDPDDGAGLEPNGLR